MSRNGGRMETEVSLAIIFTFLSIALFPGITGCVSRHDIPEDTGEMYNIVIAVDDMGNSHLFWEDYRNGLALYTTQNLI